MRASAPASNSASEGVAANAATVSSRLSTQVSSATLRHSALSTDRQTPRYRRHRRLPPGYRRPSHGNPQYDECKQYDLTDRRQNRNRFRDVNQKSGPPDQPHAERHHPAPSQPHELIEPE